MGKVETVDSLFPFFVLNKIIEILHDCNVSVTQIRGNISARVVDLVHQQGTGHKKNKKKKE